MNEWIYYPKPLMVVHKLHPSMLQSIKYILNTEISNYFQGYSKDSGLSKYLPHWDSWAQTTPYLVPWSYKPMIWQNLHHSNVPSIAISQWWLLDETWWKVVKFACQNIRRLPFIGVAVFGGVICQYQDTGRNVHVSRIQSGAGYHSNVIHVIKAWW